MRRRIPRAGGGFYDTDELPTPAELANGDLDLCRCGHYDVDHLASSGECLADDRIASAHPNHLAIEDDDAVRLERCPCVRFDEARVAA